MFEKVRKHLVFFYFFQVTFPKIQVEEHCSVTFKEEVLLFIMTPVSSLKVKSG